jgi:2-pyrone-4,6-dicarboxylate lactonase
MLDCNTHCHVFGPRERFAFAANAPFIPESDAPKEALFALNDRLGFARCVVVQSTCHGWDNSVTQDAIETRPAHYHGIALLSTNTPDAELLRLDRAGFRGVRFHYMGHLGSSVPIEEVLSFANRLEPLGWHLQLHGAPAQLLALASALQRSPVPVVIDHIARLDASLGTEQPHFKALLALMAHQHMWVKVSGMDRITAQGPPYADALPFAQTLVREFGDRVVWGNDWPHPNHSGPAPDDTQLARLIHAVAPQAQMRARLMQTNPERLYRF